MTISQQLSKTEAEPEKPGLPATWKTTLVYLCVGCLLEGITYSHVGSFFNVYSNEQKNLTATQYGAIASTYSVVVLIVTPLTAKLLSLRIIDDRTLLCLGFLVDAVFTFIMSAALYLPSGGLFFVGCLFLRTMQAIGRSVAVLMLYVIAGSELSQINHIVFPVLETIYGFSVVLGPSLSGVLFEFKGFWFPFLAIGGVLLVFALSAFCLFPKSLRAEDTVSEENKEWSLWNVPTLINALACFHSFALISFNEATLARKLRDDFDLSTSKSGAVFIFSGGVYAIASLLSGFFSKKITDPRKIVVSSLAVATLALLILGRVIPIGTDLRLTCVAQAMLGMGTGPVFVCCYLQSLRYLGGSSPSKDMYAALMALFNPATSIGCTVGPVVAGLMIDYSSYTNLAALNAVQTMSVLLALIISIYCFRQSSLTSKESSKV